MIHEAPSLRIKVPACKGDDIFTTVRKGGVLVNHLSEADIKQLLTLAEVMEDRHPPEAAARVVSRQWGCSTTSAAVNNRLVSVHFHVFAALAGTPDQETDPLRHAHRQDRDSTRLLHQPRAGRADDRWVGYVTTEPGQFSGTEVAYLCHSTVQASESR
jgi:hypothetical protein